MGTTVSSDWVTRSPRSKERAIPRSGNAQGLGRQYGLIFAKKRYVAIACELTRAGKEADPKTFAGSSGNVQRMLACVKVLESLAYSDGAKTAVKPDCSMTCLKSRRLAGDIKIKLVDIELLTIQIRLMIASVDKAKEMGMDWWATDSAFNSQAKAESGAAGDADEHKSDLAALTERLDRIESALACGGAPGKDPAGS